MRREFRGPRIGDLRRLRATHPRMDVPGATDRRIDGFPLPRKIVRLVHDLPVREVGRQAQSRKFRQKALRLRRTEECTAAMCFMAYSGPLPRFQPECRCKKADVVREGEPIRARMAIDPHRAAGKRAVIKPPQRLAMRRG